MKAVSGGLPDIGPFSWTTIAGSLLFTAHVPVREDGTFETGDMQAQAGQVFANLRKTLEAAGGSLRDVVQVTVYLADVHEARDMTERWKKFFAPPQPNRATVGIQALTIPGVRIEITATAILQNTGTR